MSYTYDQRKRTAPEASPKASRTSSAPGPSMEAIAAGLARPSTQQMGHRVDLPEAMRQKMENAFGTDFSGVRLFESQTVADAGAEAITQGNQVAFAPGKLDFSSQEGQARLGHELSHVASQARGESTGRGFLLDSGLEHQADREGAMAAAGQTVYSGPVTHTLSSAAPSPFAAGVMQAKRGKSQDDASSNMSSTSNKSGQGMSAAFQSMTGGIANGAQITYGSNSAPTPKASTFTLNTSRMASDEQFNALRNVAFNAAGHDSMPDRLAPRKQTPKKKKWFG